MNLLNILNSPIARAFSFLLFIGFCITIAYYKGYSACERDLTFKLQGAMIDNCGMPWAIGVTGLVILLIEIWLIISMWGGGK